MPETATALILAFLAGGALGAMFFGGLWWTVRKGVSSRLPALWFSGSLLLRMTIVLTGIYWVTRGSWSRMLVCMAGFLLARIVVTRMIPARTPIQGGASS